MTKISNELSIAQYLHCGKCIDEWQATETGMSPRDFAKLSVGWTVQGFQVWCNRHGCNVLHVDFEGKTHPANVTAMLAKPPSTP